MLMGGLVFAPTAAGILQGCTPGADRAFSLFSDDEFQLIRRLAETIIPETDTPGAIEAGVPAFIEEMVATVYKEADREMFLQGLAAFDERTRSEYGASFAALSEEEQHEMAVRENRQAIEGEADGEADGPPFFLVMKELVLTGFFTSEVGATQVLQHESVPGSYDGCAPLEEVGRAWAE